MVMYNKVKTAISIKLSVNQDNNKMEPAQILWNKMMFQDKMLLYRLRKLSNSYRVSKKKRGIKSLGEAQSQMSLMTDGRTVLGQVSQSKEREKMEK